MGSLRHGALDQGVDRVGAGDSGGHSGGMVAHVRAGHTSVSW